MANEAEQASQHGDYDNNDYSIEHPVNHPKATTQEQSNVLDSVSDYLSPNRSKRREMSAFAESGLSKSKEHYMSLKNDSKLLDKAIRCSLENSSIKNHKYDYEQKAELGVLSKVREVHEFENDLVIYNSMNKANDSSIIKQDSQLVHTDSRNHQENSKGIL